MPGWDEGKHPRENDGKFSVKNSNGEKRERRINKLALVYSSDYGGINSNIKFFAVDYQNWKPAQLSRAKRKKEKSIEEHKQKLKELENDSEKFKYRGDPEKYKAGLKKHWKKEIENEEKEVENINKELKKYDK